jgi:hypothetical protein
MGRKVFVVNNGGHDYSDAERFGEIVFCTETVIRKDDTAQMFRELNESLSWAKHDDYLLVSSLTSLCMIAAAIMGERFGEIHLLLYKDGQYVARDIILEE